MTTEQDWRVMAEPTREELESAIADYEYHLGFQTANEHFRKILRGDA